MSLKIKTILNEGASDILYHFTYSRNVANMIKTNKINMTAAIGTPADYRVNKKKLFFFSTTRSRSTGYVAGNTYIKLDGRKLKHRYKIAPVDYWQNSKDPTKYASTSDYIKYGMPSEQEDRIVHDKEHIPNARDYIMEVHMVVKRVFNETVDLVNACIEYDIPLYIYANDKDWGTQRNGKRVTDVSDVSYDASNDSDLPEREYSGEFYKLDTIAAMVAYNNDTIYNQILKQYPDPKVKSLLDTELETIKKGEYGYNNIDQIISRLRTSIHNNRANSHPIARFVLQILADDMRKWKATTTSIYVKKKFTGGAKFADEYRDELYAYVLKLTKQHLPKIIEDNFWMSGEIDGTEYRYISDSPVVKSVVLKYVKPVIAKYKSVIYNTTESYSDIFRRYSSDDVYYELYLASDMEIKRTANFSEDISIDIYDNGSIDDALRDTLYAIFRVFTDNVPDKFKEFKDELDVIRSKYHI
jgi:hypothetical protein